ncbi:hypothetical protein GGI42DRAFT_351685 [Trichoderma sp. SZMC 28013]
MEVVQTQFHLGSWDSSTRAFPALKFMEQYMEAIDTQNLSAPYHKWFTQTCHMTDADGFQTETGEASWTRARAIFQNWKAAKHEYHNIRLVPATNSECPTAKEGEWVMMQVTTSFWPNDPALAAGPPIRVRRYLAFLAVKSDDENQGTDGYQIGEGRVWWDTDVVKAELARRRQQIEA